MKLRIVKETINKKARFFLTKLKKNKILSVMSIFFKYVTLKKITPDGYVVLECRKPFLTIDKFSSVDNRNVSEKEIVMWLLDIANAYFQTMHFVLDARPYIEDGIDGTCIYKFKITKEW